MSSPETRVAEPKLAADIVAGGVLLVVVTVALVKSGEDRLDWLFPHALSYALGALALVLITRGLLGYGDRIAAIPPILRGQGVDVAVFVVVIVTYVALVRPLGFWLVSVVMIFSGAVYLDMSRSRRSLAVAALVAITVCVVANLVLTRVFFVPLPRGQWLPF